MNSISNNAMYALRDVPGRGKGLVATAKIPKGTRILSEKPVVTLPSRAIINEALQTSLRQQVDALSEQQLQSFLSMHNIHPHQNAADQYLGIYRTNALPIENGIDGGAIFLEACRINHACNNNCHKDWNENIKRHTVHALRDINEGEEITIYYLAVDLPREERRKALRDKLNFDCCCELCSLPAEESRKSDERLKTIQQLDEVISQGGLAAILSSPLTILRYVDRAIQLYNQQGEGDAGLSRSFLDAAQIAIAHGDLARGRIFAERAVSGWRISSGDDNINVVNHGHLTKDSTKIGVYGRSMKWKTTVNQVPNDLSPSDFEDWLWRREKPAPAGPLTSLRSRNNFPGFRDLPDDRIVDPEYFSSSGQPQRHWCLLGEIVDSFVLARLQMELKDVDSHTFPLIFYTSSRGKEISSSQIKKGYTVALLYAQHHAFIHDKPGIRLEDPNLVKIFPHSLQSLLTLSDLVRTFSAKVENFRTCHGCGKKAKSMQKCGKCSLFWYCNRVCQQAGWNEKGHKATCKVLKDIDLRGVLTFEWEKFINVVQFPFEASLNWDE